MKRKAFYFILFSALILQTQIAFSQYTGGDYAGYSSSRSDDILYDGTAPEITGDELPDIVNNLTIANPAGVTLSKNIVVNGKLKVLSGDFNLNGHTIQLGDHASVSETPGNTIYGGSGDISVTQQLNDLVDGKNVSGLGLLLKSEQPLGETTIARGHSQQEVTKNKIGASRYFDVTPANDSGLDVFVEFSYDDSEVAGIPENDLALFILHDDNVKNQSAVAKGAAALAEENWELLGGNVDTRTKAVCKGGIGDFSRLTIARGFAILASEQVTIQSSLFSEGDIHSNGNIFFGRSKAGQHIGNLTAASDIKIENGNSIAGDAYAGNKLWVSNDASFTGTAAEDVVQPINLPSPNYDFNGEKVLVESGYILTLAPGTYGTVLVKSKGILKLTAGDYHFRELIFYDEGKFWADVTNGPTNINVSHEIKFGQKIGFRIEPTGEAGSHMVTFTTQQQHEISITDGTVFLGWLIAPYAKVELKWGSIFKGSIVARDVFVGKGANFVSHGYDKPLNELPKPEKEPEEFVLIADEDIVIKAAGETYGNLHANNDIEFDNEHHSSSVHYGNVFAVDDIEVERGYRIEGEAFAGDEVENDGEITGGSHKHADVQRMQLPSVLHFNTGKKRIDVDDRRVLALEPGEYRRVRVGDGATLQLTAGTYSMKDFLVGRRATIALDVSGGEIVINVEDDLEFDRDASMQYSPSLQTEKVTINSPTSGKIDIDGGARLGCTLIAPHAKVTIGKSVIFKGSISAKEITVDRNSSFAGHSSSLQLPKTGAPALTDEQQLEAELPTEFGLSQNYPNPFNPTTTIAYQLPQASAVKISIFNTSGQMVRELVDTFQPAGSYRVQWDARDQSGQRVASGIYLYRLRADGFTTMRRMVLLK